MLSVGSGRRADGQEKGSDFTHAGKCQNQSRDGRRIQSPFKQHSTAIFNSTGFPLVIFMLSFS